MAIKIFCGSKIDHTHELEQADEIFEIINSEYAQKPEDIYLFFNFKCFGNDPQKKERGVRQIDCVIIPPKGILILELKAILGDIEGGKEGRWFFTNKDGRKEIHYDNNENVFEQVKTNRSFFAKRFTDADPVQHKKPFSHNYSRAEFFSITSSYAYFKKGSTFSKIRIDSGEEPWFKAITGDNLLLKITTLKSVYPLTSNEIEEFVKDLDLRQYDIKNNKCLDDISSVPSDVPLTSAPEKNENIPYDVDLQAKKRKIIAQELEHNGNNYLKDPPNFRKALAAFEESFELFPDPEVAFDIGFCRDKLGDLPAAEVYFDKAVDGCLNDQMLLEKLGLEFDNSTHYRHALKCYLKLKNKDDEFWRNRGDFYFKNSNNERDLALQCYERALDINPENEINFLKKAHCLAWMEKYPEALTCLQAAIERFQPENPEFYSLQGYVLVFLERPDEAWELLIDRFDVVDDYDVWEPLIEDLENSEHQGVAVEWDEELEILTKERFGCVEDNDVGIINEGDGIAKNVFEFKGHKILQLADENTRLQFGVAKAKLILDNQDVIRKFSDRHLDEIAKYISDFKGHEILQLNNGETSLQFGIRKAKLLSDNIGKIRKFVIEYSDSP